MSALQSLEDAHRQLRAIRTALASEHTGITASIVEPLVRSIERHVSAAIAKLERVA